MYAVAAVASTGLVGNLSETISAIWPAAAANAPVVLRTLPAQAPLLSGRVRFQVDAKSDNGRGSVRWKLSGPAANMMLGMASSEPNVEAALSWTAALQWVSSTVPDGTYTVTAVVSGTAGEQTAVTSTYRIENVGPTAPVRLSAVTVAAGVALTWQQAASATGAYYRLYRDQPVSGTPLTQLSGDSRSFVDSGVGPGSHEYAIVLLDAQDRASQPATTQASVATLAVSRAAAAPALKVLLPTGQELAAGGRVTDHLLLAASRMTGLDYQLSTDGAAWTSIAQSPSCSLDMCILDLSVEGLPSRPHAVRAVAGRQSSPTHTFVRAPAILSVAVVHGRATLRWDEVVGSDGYLVEKQLGPDSPFVSAGVAGGGAFVDAASTSAGAVGYRVIPLSGGVRGASSPVALAVVVPETVPAPIPSIDPPSQSSASAPTALTATAQPGGVQLSWHAVTTQDSTPAMYAVYRFDPQTGGFGLAVSCLQTMSFRDTSLPAPARYAYVVTASSPRGLESPYSDPAWASVSPSPATLSIDFSSPTQAQGALVQTDALNALAAVTAAAGIDRVSFAIAPTRGLWSDLPTAPTNQHRPSAPLAVGAGGVSLWGTTLQTTSFAPSTYHFQVPTPLP